MKITSPLGILAIAATCKQWNRSNDIDFKEQARQSLVISSGLEETAKAVDELFKALSSRLIGSIPIEDEESKFRFALNISAAVLSKACREEKLWEPFETSLIKTAYAETAEYLRDSFKADHFEQLLMPEFGREMPDSGEEGTAEGAIATAKVIIKHLPEDFKLTIPPQQPEDKIAFGSFPESHMLG